MKNLSVSKKWPFSKYWWCLGGWGDAWMAWVIRWGLPQSCSTMLLFPCLHWCSQYAPSGHRDVPYHPLRERAALGVLLWRVKDVHTAGSGLVQQASAHSNSLISQLYSNQPGNCIPHLAPAKQDHLPAHGYDTRLSLNMAGCGYSHSICTASFWSSHSTKFPHACKGEPAWQHTHPSNTKKPPLCLQASWAIPRAFEPHRGRTSRIKTGPYSCRQVSLAWWALRVSGPRCFPVATHQCLSGMNIPSTWISSSGKNKPAAQQGSAGTYCWLHLYWCLCLLLRLLSRTWHAGSFSFLIILIFKMNQQSDRRAACKVWGTAVLLADTAAQRGALVLSCHLLKLPSTWWMKMVPHWQVLGWLFRLGADEQPFPSPGLAITFIQLRQVVGHLSLFLWKM